MAAAVSTSEAQGLGMEEFQGMIELLLQYGANVNVPDSRGQTPIQF